MSIEDALNKRAEELMVFKQPKNGDLMTEIFAFDPRNLEATSSADISKYTIGLGQFLIYLQAQINKTKVQLMQKNRVIETYINQSELKGKTKADKRQKVINAHEELQAIDKGIELLECEIQLTEGQDKYYTEVINGLKRELTRREFEMKFSRDERRL